MNVTGTIKAQGPRMAMGAFLAIACGLALWRLPFGQRWVHASFDVPTLFAQPAVPTNMVIIGMDQPAHDAMGITHGQWPRQIHARLLDQLRADGCRLVVFDVVFMGTSTPEADSALREAIGRHGDRAVLAAIRAPNPDAQFASEYTWRPTALLSPKTRWGIVGARLDHDLAVREIFTGLHAEPSLAWAVAEGLGAALPDLATANRQRFWIRYHGSAGVVPYLSYHVATNQPPGFFRDRIVFIGGKPSPLYLDEKSDIFHTPFTAWTGKLMPGVELVATMTLNLAQGDWLRRMSAGNELLLLLLAGLISGAGLSLVRPLPALGLAAGGILAVAIIGMATFWSADTWWAWGVVAGAQIPCAVTWSVLYRTHWLTRVLHDTLTAPAPAAVSVPSSGVAGPRIPEHTLIRRIGEGAYGEVWLARDVLGTHRAVKVVYASRFGGSVGPFEREYRGISAYAPISLSHPSLLHVLFVGRCEAEGYFYYIMELGDDRKSGPVIDPATYTPKNLDQDLEVRRFLPVAECVALGEQLAGALHHLHTHKLIHRDIKPANVVFVQGVPKLADIGLVTSMTTAGKEVSNLGTEGYIAPEGAGAPVADVFSLGIVLYRMATGLAAKEFPSLPATLYDRADLEALMQLNSIILTACALEPEDRYPSAALLQTALRDLKVRLAQPAAVRVAGRRTSSLDSPAI